MLRLVRQRNSRQLTTGKGENMNTLKRLGAAIVLTFVLGLSAFAGEIQNAPCAPPDPGVMEGPPCAAPRVPEDSATPVEVVAPFASNTVDILSVVDAAMNLLLLF